MQQHPTTMTSTPLRRPSSFAALLFTLTRCAAVPLRSPSRWASTFAAGGERQARQAPEGQDSRSSSSSSSSASISPTAPATASSSLCTDFGVGLPAQRPPPKLHYGNIVYAVEPRHKRGTFRRYLRYGFQRPTTPGAGVERALLVGAAAGMVLALAATLGIPMALGILLDGATAGELPTGTSTLLFTLFAVLFVGRTARLCGAAAAGERTTARLRRRFYRSALQQEMRLYDADPAGTRRGLEERLTLDCALVGSSLTATLTTFLNNAALTVGGTALMYHLTPPLTAAAGGLAVPFIVFGGVYGRLFRRHQDRHQAANAAMREAVSERLHAVAIIKTLQTQSQEEAWFGGTVERCRALASQSHFNNTLYGTSLQLVGCGGLLCLVWAGSLLIASHQMTVGSFLGFCMYFIYALVGAVGLTSAVRDVNRGYAAWLRVFDVIEKGEALELEAKRRRAATSTIRSNSSGAYGEAETGSKSVEQAAAEMTASVLLALNKRTSALQFALEHVRLASPTNPAVDLLKDVHIPGLFCLTDGSEGPSDPSHSKKEKEKEKEEGEWGEMDTRIQTIRRDARRGPPPPPRVTCVVGERSDQLSGVARLLAQLYTPTAGRITVCCPTSITKEKEEEEEEERMMAIPLAALSQMASAVAYVGPEPLCLTGSVADNIAYGSADHHWGEPMDPWLKKAVVEAAMTAGLHQLVAALPQGYETMIAGSSTTTATHLPRLSAADQQLLSLARALLRRPALLVLDQVTSGLDAKGSLVVERAIAGLCCGAPRETAAATTTTTAAGSRSLPVPALLICTSRLPLLELAQRVIVLEEEEVDGGAAVAVQGSWAAVRDNAVLRRAVGLAGIQKNSINAGHEALPASGGAA
eukprot:gene3764-2655_t